MSTVHLCDTAASRRSRARRSSQWMNRRKPVLWKDGRSVNLPSFWTSTKCSRIARVEDMLFSPGLKGSAVILIDQLRCDPDRLLGQMVAVRGVRGALEIEVCILCWCGKYQLFSLCGDRSFRPLEENRILGRVTAVKVDPSSI
jgi:hypothetical protein